MIIDNPNNELLKCTRPECLRCGLKATNMAQLCSHCYDLYINEGATVEEIIYLTNMGKYSEQLA